MIIIINTVYDNNVKDDNIYDNNDKNYNIW